MTAYVVLPSAKDSFSECRYAHTPGIYTKTHIEGWRDITKATKDAGAVFFCQLWHVGRSSHAGDQHLLVNQHQLLCMH